MSGPHVPRSPAGDIPPRFWHGGPVDCARCAYAHLRAAPGRDGCEPGHACMQDAYARRIDRFFLWHPALANEQLAHPYFEVRAIAARYADVFRLPAMIDDPDETVRLQLALRLPHAYLARLAADPQREVRIRVAQRLAPAALAGMRDDPDYGVRECVARRLPAALLASMARDADRGVRTRVAERLEMPALLRMADDAEADVRRIVARRLPAALLGRLLGDADWRVRWELARRAHPGVVVLLLDDVDDEVRALARRRLRSDDPSQQLELDTGADHD
ncbi:Uncharacterized 27.7 kDa protein in nifB 3'region [Burkholderia multivorans]